MEEMLAFSKDFLEMMVRFVVCLVFNWFIIDRLYYKKSRRRDFYFTFMLTSVAIFFLVFYMIFGLDDLGGKTSMGIGIGLFGIFSIMRYRTDTMPAREMTYLFVVVSLSVVNAISSRVSLAEILVTNLIVVLAIWICEKHLKAKSRKLVQYDRIELIVPERREELIADLEKRLGIKVLEVEVGSVDMLRDMAMLRVTYDGDNTSANSILKLRREELSQF
ncbi:MAG: DUF4956 domain-containing protein [Prevotella sp.]|nr:DUF4956 domain-containing protein [Prevotella sp.]